MGSTGARAARRTGQVLTGLGALVVLAALLGGAPAALYALAGDPLPDHLPTLTELGTALTSRDDGQLFLRALALLGWAGWATFALSVLVELPARLLRRPAPRLPGMGRQQRAAAALVGSVALILAGSPAAAMAATVAGPAAYAAAPVSTAAFASGAGLTGAGLTGTGPSGTAKLGGGTAALGQPATVKLGTTRSGLAGAQVGMGHAPPAAAAAAGRAAVGRTADAAVPPVYRVAHGDYLGRVAERYLGDFRRYPEISRLNDLRDPNRIAPGQLLRLPGTRSTTASARTPAAGWWHPRPGGVSPPRRRRRAPAIPPRRPRTRRRPYRPRPPHPVPGRPVARRHSPPVPPEPTS
nr:LysM peptidoglycan-binding domain-containing protein [Plantactinospora sp. KBS50]